MFGWVCIVCLFVGINYIGMNTGTRRRTDDLDVATRADFGFGKYLGYFSSLDVMRMRWEPNWVFTGPKT